MSMENSMGKSTISMDMFNSQLLVYQIVYSILRQIHLLWMLATRTTQWIPEKKCTVPDPTKRPFDVVSPMRPYPTENEDCRFNSCQPEHTRNYKSILDSSGVR